MNSKPLLLSIWTIALGALGAACGPIVDSAHPIQIEFGVYAADELSTSGGGSCAPVPVDPTSGTLQKQSGLLELNPAFNPNAQYVLNLQVANNAAKGDSEGDFHPEKAVIRYIDIEGNLTGTADNAGIAAPSDVSLVSGEVAAGETAVFQVAAVTANEVIPWVESFLTNERLGPGAYENVIAQVQLIGTTSSGAVVSSSAFGFPLTLCFGCGGTPMIGADDGMLQLWTADCPGGAQAIAVGHGPCCAPQDFYVSCSPCGGSVGSACCPGNNLSQVATCAGALACTGPPAGEVCTLIPFALEVAATCASAG